MNPFKKALDEIRFNIPQEILQAAFLSRDMQQYQGMASLDTIIRDKVIDPRVCVDLDLHGGTDCFIPLGPPVEREIVDLYTCVYRIPDEVTQNRPITQIYTIHFGPLNYQSALQIGNVGSSPMQAAMSQVLDSAMRTPIAATSYINKIGYNVFSVRFNQHVYPQAFARVRLGNDNALSHIRPILFPEFAKLCVMAVKSYIYNNMMIYIDQGQLSGGQTLGQFRTVVESWSEMETLYQDQLRKWNKMMVYNDPEASRRWHRTIAGRG